MNLFVQFYPFNAVIFAFVALNSSTIPAFPYRSHCTGRRLAGSREVFLAHRLGG